MKRKIEQKKKETKRIKPNNPNKKEEEKIITEDDHFAEDLSEYGRYGEQEYYDENEDNIQEQVEEEDYEDISYSNVYKDVQKFKRNQKDFNITEKLVFQQLECDYYIGDAIEGFTGNDKGKIPIIRFYGLTKEGNSVLAHVRGVFPHFYVEIDEEMVGKVKMFYELFEELLSDVKKPVGMEYVHDIKVVEKESIYGYSFGKKIKCLHVFLGMPKFVQPLRKALEQGVNLLNFGFKKFNTYESNVLFHLRYMVDNYITSSSWLEVNRKDIMIRTGGKKEEFPKTSNCCIEFDISYDKIIHHKPEGEWSDIAPLRILSFDIECAAEGNHFPTPEKDPVIQISNHIQIYGQKDYLVKNVFTLKSCDKIKGADVYCFEKEEDLLEAWRFFVIMSDPDIITGYNIENFDFPYLLKRATRLGLKKFNRLSKIKNEKCVVRQTKFVSKQYGTREYESTSIKGRIQFDPIIPIRKQYKLDSYTLNFVSGHFIGDQKNDVHHSQIPILFKQNSMTRRTIALYCLKDSELPLKLLDKLMLIVQYIEMSRVTGISIELLMQRGEQIKVFSQILRNCKDKGIIVPNLPNKKAGKYQGARVFPPKVGYYSKEKKIVTLDFASLYPSIMMAHNLCYTSLIPENRIDEYAEKFGKDSYIEIKINTKEIKRNSYFAKKEVKYGILPEIVAELVEARKRVKKEMEEEKDPFKWCVLNARQLALKVCANSVYGFTGAQMGVLPCVNISESVTFLGRGHIEKSKNFAEETYNSKNIDKKTGEHFHFDAEVIYGDTDSIMVSLNPVGNNEVSMDHAMKIKNVKRN